MLRKFALIGALGAVLFTATACDPNELVQKVQAYTTKVCGFVPTASTVIDLLKVFGVNTPAGVTDVANQICATVTKKQARRGGSGPVLRGVRIKGQFVARGG